VWKKRYDKYNTSVESINYVSKTNIYTCKGCKKNECYVYELQTRSADEPMTIFITCVNCGKKWRN
jgi:transcription elongation factor S-II